MEIIAKIDSFSFYHNKGCIYSSIQVIEKNITDELAPEVAKYKAVTIGDTIGLKYSGPEPLKILPLLTEIILRIKIRGVEKPQKTLKNNNEIKFTFVSVEKCAILAAN